jgi:hypothetical protein
MRGRETTTTITTKTTQQQKPKEKGAKGGEGRMPDCKLKTHDSRNEKPI